MADLLENMEIDKDTVGESELNNLFSKKYNLLTETAVTLAATYINKLSLTKSLNIAVSLLDNTIEVYKIDDTSLKLVCQLSGHDKTLTELVFSPNEDYLLYSSGHDGIKMWDTRAGGSFVQEYEEEDNEPIRPYDTMDISCTGRVICGGTQLVRDDAFLVFWDQRKCKTLGGYWNSHTDDITQVKFHKEKTEILVSGSVDGLLNVYNILEETEDNALTYSMNVENSVEKVTWLSDTLVSCITQSNDLQLWDVSTGQSSRSYNRGRISRGIKRRRPDDCYVVDTFMCADDVVLLAGSYGGGGNVLRSLTEKSKKLQPTADFDENRQIVRCCAYNEDQDVLVTAGESGLVSVWGTESFPKPEPKPVCIPRKPNKSQKVHDKRHKPY